MNVLYKKLLKPILFLFDPENVHNLFVWVGEFLGSNMITRTITGLFYGYDGPDISKTVDGIKYRVPVVLAAGFDYNARLFRILPCVAFGGEEVGSVTARPCKGNPAPRLKRLPRSRAIIVNKGLKNDGVDVIIERLKKQKTYSDFVIGISIARTNDDQSVSIEAGIADYCYSFKRLNEENVGDYYVLNISCPNAFGAEAFIDPVLMDQLLVEIKKIPCNKPIYVKMPINVAWDSFKALLEVIDKYGLNGVVIGNLNKDYNSLDYRNEAPAEYSGGLSGKPCFDISNELIRKTREVYGSRFTIIGVGGIMSAEDALTKFEAGADLVQLITGMIYEGPGLVKKICQKLGAVERNKQA